MDTIKGFVTASNALYQTLAKTHIKDSWAATLIKELWQNIIDLDSVSSVDISINQEGDTTLLTITDDGPGMSLEVLREVYLVYGETTKRERRIL